MPINGEHDKVPRTSIMGELVKIFSLWWEIQHFVKQYVDNYPGDSLKRISTLLALDRRLEIFFENLHPDFRYLGLSSFTSLKTDPCRLFSLHCIYHLCACVLHSSIVPIFSGTPSDPQISKKLARMSAEEAVKHSMITIDMAMAFLSICPDKSRLSGITGYALFVSSTVQFKSLSAQGKLQSQGTSRCNAAILILEQLKEYWCPLRGMWTSLEALFSSANININNLSTGKDRKAGPPDPNTDIEQIVTQKAVSHGSSSNIDLYTYVATLESTADSPRCSSASTNPQDNIPQAQAAASILKTMSAAGQKVVLPMHAGHGSSPGPSTASNYTYQPSAAQLQSYHAPPTQSQAFDCRLGTQQDFDTLTASSSRTSPPAGFAPMSTTAEGVVGYQMPIQGQGQELAYVMDSVPMAMEIDSSNLWWDHSFEKIETDPYGSLLEGYPWGERGGYYIPSG